jgi:hypothetical protein
MNQVINLDQILTHNDTIEDRLDKDNVHKRLKRGVACFYRYSSRPTECNIIGDIVGFFLNPIGAMVTLAKKMC